MYWIIIVSSILLFCSWILIGGWQFKKYLKNRNGRPISQSASIEMNQLGLDSPDLLNIAGRRRYVQQSTDVAGGSTHDLSHITSSHTSEVIRNRYPSIQYNLNKYNKMTNDIQYFKDKLATTRTRESVANRFKDVSRKHKENHNRIQQEIQTLEQLIGFSKLLQDKHYKTFNRQILKRKISK